MQNYFIQTNRLYLRKMTMNDFEEIATMLKNPEVMYAWEYNFENCDIENWILKNLALYEKYGLGYFMVVHKSTNTIVGQAALMPDEINGKNYYEIGYILKKEHWNKGFATECAKALSLYSIKNFPNYETIFEIRPNNERSIKVAKRLGAKIVGSFNKTFNGKEMEHLIYKIFV